MADAEITLHYIADLSEAERALEAHKRRAEAAPLNVGSTASVGAVGGLPGRPGALQPPGIGAVIPSSVGGMGLVGGPPPSTLAGQQIAQIFGGLAGGITQGYADTTFARLQQGKGAYGLGGPPPLLEQAIDRARGLGAINSPQDIIDLSGALGGFRKQGLQGPALFGALGSHIQGLAGGNPGGTPPNLQQAGVGSNVLSPAAAAQVFSGLGISQAQLAPVSGAASIAAAVMPNWTGATATVGVVGTGGAGGPPSLEDISLLLPQLGQGRRPPPLPGTRQPNPFFGPPNAARAFTLSTLAGREVLNAVEAQNRAATASLLADDPISALQARQQGIEAQNEGLVGPIVSFAADIFKGQGGPTAQREQIQFEIFRTQRGLRTGDLLFESSSARTIRDAGPTGTLSNKLATATVASEARQRGTQKEIANAEAQQNRPLEPDYLEETLNPLGLPGIFKGSLALLYQASGELTGRTAARQSNYRAGQDASFQVALAAKTRQAEETKDLTRTHAELERDHKFEQQHLNRQTDYFNAQAAGGYGKAFELDEQRANNDLLIRQAFEKAQGAGPADLLAAQNLSANLTASERAAARLFRRETAERGIVLGAITRTSRRIAGGSFAPLALILGQEELARDAFALAQGHDPLAQEQLDASLAEAAAGRAGLALDVNFQRRNLQAHGGYYGRRQQGASESRARYGQLVEQNEAEIERRHKSGDPNAAAFERVANRQIDFALEQLERNEFTSAAGIDVRNKSLAILNQTGRRYAHRAQEAALSSIYGETLQAERIDQLENEGRNFERIKRGGLLEAGNQRQAYLGKFQADEAPSLNRVAVQDPGTGLEKFGEYLKKLAEIQPDVADINRKLTDFDKTN